MTRFLVGTLTFILATLFFPPSANCGEPIHWAADSEGGAPFIFANPSNPSELLGYELEVVDAIGNALGRKPVFTQNQWDGLIPGLKARNYEFAMNGIEITEDRKQEVLFSDPYLITYEQLTVRKDEYTIHSLDDCVGKKVGTLKATLAERILQAKRGIEIVTYDGNVAPYEDLANGRLDAVLLDYPIHLYYGALNDQLKPVGGPIGHMEYGIAIAKDNHKLQMEVNQALTVLKKSGKLREIYERWGLWNKLTAEEFQDANTTSLVRPIAYEAYLKAVGKERTWRDRFKQYLSFVPLLGKGAIVTLELSIISMLIASALGLFVCLLRLYGPKLASTLAVVYIEAVRGTPLLVQLFFIFYGLPYVGIRLSPFIAAVIGLALNYSAYEAENLRAGILSIPKGQSDAAKVLGLTRSQSLRYVILPQSLRLVIPPMTNDFISLLKDSSLVSVITMVELTKVYGQLASTYYDYFGIGILTALMYFAIGLPFVRLARLAETRLARFKQGYR